MQQTENFSLSWLFWAALRGLGFAGAVLVLTEGCPARAQVIAETAGVGIEFAPSTGLRDESDTTVDPGFSFNNVRAGLMFPFVLGDSDTVLLTGFSYRSFWLRSDEPQEVDGSEVIHDLNVQVGAITPMARSWQLFTLASAGLATDFDDVDGSHFRYQLLGLAIYEINAEWTLGFGALSTNIFGDPLVLPSVQLTYRDSDWDISLSPPQLGRVRYTLTEGLDVAWTTQVIGNRFSLGAQSPLEVDSVVYSLGDTGIALGFQLAGPLWFEAYGGATLFRLFELRDDANETIVNLDQMPGSIFRFSIGLRG